MLALGGLEAIPARLFVREMRRPADLFHARRIESDFLRWLAGLAPPDPKSRRLALQAALRIPEILVGERLAIGPGRQAAGLFRSDIESVGRIADTGNADGGEDLVDGTAHSFTMTWRPTV